MEYRAWKGTELEVSLLGMGCMRFPLTGKGMEIDYGKSEEIIDYAYAHGVNYYDTAYVYNDNDSERVTGKALSKYPRESYMLATKLPDFKCGSKEEVLETVRGQLERCGVEYFDFYLCHNIMDHTIGAFKAPHVQEALEELRAEGAIRKLGFSCHGSPECLEEFAKFKEWDFAQIQLNYLDWDYTDAKHYYEILTNLDIPVIIMEPVRGGLLASLGTDANKLFTDHSPEASVASWAIRFAASLPNVLTVLSGMSTMEQVADNVKTISAFKPVDDEEKAIMFKAAKMLLSNTIVPCTGCRYCCPSCPRELDIPYLLDIHNDYLLEKTPFALMGIRQMDEDKRPDKCEGCGSCLDRCPQSIDIPAQLAKLAEEFAAILPPPGA